MSNNEWSREHFRARQVNFSGPGLEEAKRLEVIFKIDGKVVATLQAREPGLVAVSSRVDTDDIRLHVVQAMEATYTDFDMPGDGSPKRPDRWQFSALGFPDE